MTSHPHQRVPSAAAPPSLAAAGRWYAALCAGSFAVACIAICGCAKTTEANPSPNGAPSAESAAVPVHVAPVQRRTIVRSIAVPGVIQAYEQTAVYAKIAGYVLSWVVDLGDQVKKDQLMATLMVPELVEQHREKLAQLEQQRQAVIQAQEAVVIAERNLQVATSAIAEAKADVERYHAATMRWQAEYKRLKELAAAKAVDIRVVEEAQEHFRAEQSAERAANVVVTTKETERLAAVAEVDKAKVNVIAAEAAVKVAEATAARYAALLEYTRVVAPYDGVVTARNVSVGDLVRPGTGEGGTAEEPPQAGNKSIPLYVVARMDKLMFVLGIPELEAGYVHTGTPIRIRVHALGIPEIETSISRVSSSIGLQSRTLMAQVDLPNQHDKLMPGMYASGTVTIDRRDVPAIPTAAVVAKGDQRTCFFVVDGRAVQYDVQLGVSNDQWAELLLKRIHAASASGQWVAVSSDDQVIARNPSELIDGAKVEVVNASDDAAGSAGSSSISSNSSSR